MDYQAVYDAIRSRVSRVNIDDVIRCELQNMNLSFYAERASARCLDAIAEYDRPSTIYKPKLSSDGNMWCALLGDNLQDGVAGFGKSPSAAYVDFDNNWCKTLSEGK